MQRLLTAFVLSTALAFFASAATASPPPEAAKPAKEEKAKKEVKKEKKEPKAKEAAKEGETKAGKKGKGKGKEEAKAGKAPDPKKVAKDAFDSGKKKFDAEDYQGALDDFMVANNTLPNPFVYVKIADCYEKLGNAVEAIAWLKKYTEEKPDAANVKEINDRIEKLGATPGKVAASSDPAGAKIILDDQDTGKITPDEIEVKPGQHTLKYDLEGYVSDSKTFEMLPGSSQELTVTLAKAEVPEMISEEYPEEEGKSAATEEAGPKEEEPPPPKVNKGVWAAAGIAGAGIISATVFGILALNQEADFEDVKDQGPNQGEDPAAWNSRLDDIKSKGKAYAIVCDVSWGVAAAATVTGIIVYYVTNKPKKEKKVGNVILSPLVTPSGAGAAASFNF
jgi:tetratricopeptide (TPR) repeat protein